MEGTIHIFGKDIKKSTFYGALAVLALGVVAFFYFRARAATGGAAAAAPQAAPSDGGGGSVGGGGGGGIAVPVGTQQQADQYQQQLEANQVAASNFALQQQQVQANQQQAMFGLQYQQQQTGLAHQDVQAGLQDTLLKAWTKTQAALLGQETQVGQAQANLQQAQYGAQQAAFSNLQNYEQFAQTREISCPGTASVRRDPTTGQLYCRQKTGGSILGIPVGQIFDAVGGFFSGVQQAAPQVGYNATQAAGAYYSGQLARGGVAGLTGGSQGQPQQNVRAPQQSYPLGQLSGGFNPQQFGLTGIAGPIG